MKHDTTQNINRQEQLKDRTTYILKWHTQSTYQYRHTIHLGPIGGEALCREVLLYLFMKPGLLFIWSIWDGRKLHVIMVLYNTVWFIEFVLYLGTVKRPLVACLMGLSVCVRAVCKLTMQTIWNFQHINVSYKKRKWRSQSLLNS